MSAEIVNLRRARKDKARQARAVTAEENRRRHGTPRAERARQGAERSLADRRLDGARRTSGGEPADER